MKNLIKTIQNTAFQNSLWTRGSKIVLGVSGGPDSVCLLDTMSKIAPKADLELIIAHVNYGLRGKDSDRDEEFVRKLGEEKGIKVEVLRDPIPLKGSHPFGSTLASRRGTTALDQNGHKRSDLHPSENELREIRYDFFEKIRKENEFDSIAVAHNMDDQAETFLMRIIRGSGLQGLSGMKYKTGEIIRPLLNISRKEILEHLKSQNQDYRTDRTNTTDIFFRNKVRNKLIPFIEKNFNPKIKETVFDATTSIAEDYSFLEEYVGELARNQKEISVKKLLALHPAIQRRLLLHYIKEKKADLKDIEASHIDEILKALKSTKGKNQVVVFKGLKLLRIAHIVNRASQIAYREKQDDNQFK